MLQIVANWPILEMKIPVMPWQEKVSWKDAGLDPCRGKAFFHKIPVEVYLYNHLVVEFLHYE